MNKAVKWCYVAILSIFSVTSVSVAWAHDLKLILAAEIIINTLIILGFIFYILKKSIKLWRPVFFLLVIGQSFIFYTDNGSDLESVLIWLAMLIPAFYGNFKVSFEPQSNA